MLAAASLVLAAPQADAITGCPAGTIKHCYAEGEMGQAWSGAFVPINEIGGDLYIDCLTVPTDNDFVNYESWLDTDLNNAPIDDYWVEGGAKLGIGVSGAWEGYQWFWADSRPNGGGYHEHYLGSASTYSFENVSFTWLGSGDWDVKFAGTVVGESVGAGDYAGGAQTGVESTSGGSAFYGWTRYWQYADSSWKWHPVSAAGYGGVVIGPLDAQSQAVNDSPGDDIYNSGIGSSSCLAEAGPVENSSSTPTPAATAGTGIPKTAAANGAPQAFTGASSLSALAAQAAKANGVTDPTDVRYVQTTRAKVAALTGASAQGGGNVYVVELHGHFDGAYASVPKGGKTPTGDTLTIVVDAATGAVTDVGLTDSATDPVNIATLGTAQALPTS